MSQSENREPEGMEIITQEDLLAVRIIEKMGLTPWNRVYRSMVNGAPVKPGDLQLAVGWVPCDPLVVESDQDINELQRLNRAIAFYERHVARLKEQRDTLRKEQGVNLFALASRFAESF